MPSFNEQISSRLSPRHLKSLALARPFKNRTILNIGCYNGWLEKYASEEGAVKVIGIDTNEKHVALAKKEVPKANFIKSSVLSLPFEKQSFDTICFFEVLEHLPKKSVSVAAEEISRVSKQGGKLILSTPHHNIINNFSDPAWYLGHRHYNTGEVLKIFERVGFKPSTIEIKGGFFQITTLNLIYIFKWLFSKEIPFKNFLNRKREEEYLSNKQGVHTLFAVFVKEN